MNPSRVTPLRVGVAVVWLLFVIVVLASSGVGGALLAIAIPALVIGIGALLVGGARWAFVDNRRSAGAVIAAALVLFIIGGALLPAPPQPVAGPLTTTPPTTTEVSTTTIPTTTTTTATTTTTTTTRPPTTTTTRRTTTQPPTRRTTTRPPTRRTTTAAPKSNCDPSYPTFCIPVGAPDLDCGDIPHRKFPVRGPDPHGFDGKDNDGIGCES